ncbi:MAG: GEVED domain-containing protein [Xanthomarina sp.]
MKKITMLFVATLASSLMWTSSNAQSIPCSQETPAGAEVENGFGPLHQTLIFANDLDMNGLDSFTLNSIKFNALIQPGQSITGVKFHFYENSVSGGPGLEMDSTPMIVPTSVNNIGTAFTFDRMQVSVDLPTPFVFTGGAAVSVYWIGIKLAYTGSSSYLEVVSTLNTPNEIYFLDSGVWIAGSNPSAFEQIADGVMSFYGDCVATVYPPCTGMPDAGVAMANPVSGAPGSTYVVSAINYTNAMDMSYQWQSNLNGLGWVNEGAATTSYAVYSATAPALGDVVTWRLASTCTTSGDTANSATASFTSLISYCNVAFPSNVEPITLVNFGDINNTTSATINGTPALEDFTAQATTVNQGESYPITIKGNTDGSFTSRIVVYIDWNQDGIFDNSVGSPEMYELPSIVGSTGVDTKKSEGLIEVPASAMLGNTRMRVIKKFNTVPTPCNTAGYGQAEDYTITVDPALSINENSMLVGTRLYPNPLKSGTFFVHAPKLNGEQVQVNIADMAGRQIFNNTLSVNDNKVTVSVNNDLTSGLYLVTLKHAGESHTFRLIKD